MRDVLPDVPRHKWVALAQSLKAKEGMQRPPEATAKMGAFCVYRWPLPFPERPVVAKHLGISVASVDVFLSQRQGTGDITIHREIVPGGVKQRVSTKQLRRIEPCPEWIAIVRGAR
jgi:hypothetical protein